MNDIRKPTFFLADGFTLVELAIVMIIIGLLIGGVLQGQRLIDNARVTAAVSQIEDFTTALITFQDIYDAFPGDMANPTARLPACADACALAGNGNGRLEARPYEDPWTDTESQALFPHLAAADLVAGIDPRGDGSTWGARFPESRIGRGGYHPGYASGGSATLPAGWSAPLSGHYLALNPAVDARGGVITPLLASMIDRKIDDGKPGHGAVMDSAIWAEDLGCAATDQLYDTTRGTSCSLFIRLIN